MNDIKKQIESFFNSFTNRQHIVGTKVDTIEMNNIKKQFEDFFHGLTNRQHIVSIKAGGMVILAHKKNYASLSREELLNEVTYMLEEVCLIEKTILEAGNFAKKIDDTVWPLLKTLSSDDTNKPVP